MQDETKLGFARSQLGNPSGQTSGALIADNFLRNRRFPAQVITAVTRSSNDRKNLRALLSRRKIKILSADYPIGKITGKMRIDGIELTFGDRTVITIAGALLDMAALIRDFRANEKYVSRYILLIENKLNNRVSFRCAGSGAEKRDNTIRMGVTSHRHYAVGAPIDVDGNTAAPVNIVIPDGLGRALTIKQRKTISGDSSAVVPRVSAHDIHIGTFGGFYPDGMISQNYYEFSI